jgi:hypothetical protein
MLGAYRVAGRLMEKIKDPTAREGFKQRQASLQKAIEKVEQRIKEVEDRIRAAEPKNLSGKTDREIRDLAEKIAKGHSWDKHVIKKDEYPEIKTKENFSRHIKDVMEAPTEFHDRVDGENFPRNREIYGDEKSGTVVIYDPVRKDLGTAFRPRDGVRQYIDDFLNQERNEIAKLKAKKGRGQAY